MMLVQVVYILARDDVDLAVPIPIQGIKRSELLRLTIG